jgi:hypothetical protein
MARLPWPDPPVEPSLVDLPRSERPKIRSYAELLAFISAVTRAAYDYAAQVLDAQLPRQHREAHAGAINDCIKALEFLRQHIEQEPDTNKQGAARRRKRLKRTTHGKVRKKCTKPKQSPRG